MTAWTWRPTGAKRHTDQEIRFGPPIREWLVRDGDLGTDVQPSTGNLLNNVASQGRLYRWNCDLYVTYEMSPLRIANSRAARTAGVSRYGRISHHVEYSLINTRIPMDVSMLGSVPLTNLRRTGNQRYHRIEGGVMRRAHLAEAGINTYDLIMAM